MGSILLPDQPVRQVSFRIEVDPETLNVELTTEGLSSTLRHRECAKSACVFLLAKAKSTYGDDFLTEVLEKVEAAQEHVEEQEET